MSTAWVVTEVCDIIFLANIDSLSGVVVKCLPPECETWGSPPRLPGDRPKVPPTPSPTSPTTPPQPSFPVRVAPVTCVLRSAGLKCMTKL